MNDYQRIQPIAHAIPAERQGAKRHYGVHPYFTRRPFNVVRNYIRHFTRDGDTVLDPFGGSGVTAIEAFLENRIGIQNDINPLANFIATGIANLSRGQQSVYQDALAKLEATCQEKLTDLEKADEKNVRKYLDDIQLPTNRVLPKNADVTFLYDLFLPKQLAALAILKKEIGNLSDRDARRAMQLAFSATITKLNLTFLSATGRAPSRGGSSVFSIYRYKIAKEPVSLPLWPTFRERAENVLDAKAEIDKIIEVKRKTSGWKGEFKVYKSDVLELPKTLKEPVDYIFTDPPYGGHISYIDLSTMWNAWLGTIPTRTMKQKEIIVGGDESHSEEIYISRLGESIRVCVEMLKKDRWLSVVFQHWNTAYFQAILTSAADSGAEIRAAVSQVGDPIWSMHKKKGSESVLAGELILTFFKTGTPIGYDIGRNFDLEAELFEMLKTTDEPLYGELLLNKIVLKAWNQGAIDSLEISKDEFSRLLESFGWQYDTSKHFWLRGRQQRMLI